MKNEITFQKINGVLVPKMRGGRYTKVIKDKKQYDRKQKHKGATTWARQ